MWCMLGSIVGEVPDPKARFKSDGYLGLYYSLR
jgi:hypothetical protein